MRIWVDADACPAAAKEILYRAAERTRVPLTLVANQAIRTPPSRFIRTIQVPPGFDMADNRILEATEPGDLVITADIPLAAGVLDKGGIAIDPRGEVFTRDNIKERLAMRKLMDELRTSGVETGGPASYAHADRQAFAAALDRILAARPG